MNQKFKQKINYLLFNTNRSDKWKVKVNLIFYFSLRFFVLIYLIIRIVLINLYLGIENLGLINLALTVTPIFLVMISAIQTKSMYVLYNCTFKNDYVKLNKIINEQINEMKFFSFISVFAIVFLILVSSFLLHSPGATPWLICLLIISSSVEYLLMGIILPYVQWYLNSINMNFFYDLLSIFMATISNILCFIFIGLFGTKVINFGDTSHAEGAVYILLIVNFLLTFRFWITNLILNSAKRKYMPWFHRIKIKNQKYFNKTTNSYLIQTFLQNITLVIIILVFYILTFFIHLSTSLLGIYYGYADILQVIYLISGVVVSLRPYLAKIIFTVNSESLFLLNKLVTYISFFFGCWIFINFIVIAPYILIFIHSYFSFVIAFLIGLVGLITCLKSVDESFIYIDGRPQKYLKLTLIELGVYLVCIIISLSIIFLDKNFSDNILNILYALIICELVGRSSKYVLNIIYLVKEVYKISFKKYFKTFALLYGLFLGLLIICSFSIGINNFIVNIPIKYVATSLLSIWSHLSINLLLIDNIHLINWVNLIFFLIFFNAAYLLIIYLFIHFFNKKYDSLIRNLFNSISKRIFK